MEGTEAKKDQNNAELLDFGAPPTDSFAFDKPLPPEPTASLIEDFLKAEAGDFGFGRPSEVPKPDDLGKFDSPKKDDVSKFDAHKSSDSDNFHAPKSDFEAPMSDFDAPKSDFDRFDEPKSDFEVPKSDFEVPKSDFDAPKRSNLDRFDTPKSDFDAPKNDFDRFDAPKDDFDVPKSDFDRFDEVKSDFDEPKGDLDRFDEAKTYDFGKSDWSKKDDSSKLDVFVGDSSPVRESSPSTPISETSPARSVSPIREPSPLPKEPSVLPKQVTPPPLMPKEEVKPAPVIPPRERPGSASDIAPKDLFANIGLVESLVYWRDAKKSGVVFGVTLACLLSLVYCSLISVLSYLCLLTLFATVSFRIYKNVMQAVQKTSDGHPFKELLEVDIEISEDKAKEGASAVVSHINCWLTELRRLFLVVDLVDSLKFGVCLWALTYVGALFNGLSLIILCWIALFSLPKVYENNKQQVDAYLELATAKISEITNKVKAALPGKKEEKKDQ